MIRIEKLQLLSDRVADQYRGESGNAYHVGKRHVSDFQRNLLVQDRARKFGRFDQPESKVFEYGSGDGWNVAGLRAKEIDAYDIGGTGAIAGLSGEIQVCRDLEQLPENHYDLCICHHVLEHVPVPIYTLLEIHEKLALHGTLFLCVPFEKDAESHRYCDSDRDHHIYTWSPQSLGNLAKLAGFSVVSMRVCRFGCDRAASRYAELTMQQAWLFHPFRFLMRRIRPKYEIQCELRKEQSGPAIRSEDGERQAA